MSPVEESKIWPQILVVFTASICNFIAGLHTGWPAPSLPQLFNDEYPFDVSKEEGSYITVTGNFGNIFGGFISYLLLDRVGRRKTILLVMVPQVCSFVSYVLSYEVMEFLYVGRFLGGVGEGMSITVTLLYVGEITEPRIRGTLSTLVAFCYYLGILYINIIGSVLSINVTAYSCLIFPVLSVVFFWKMPESPYYLQMQNRDEETKKALKFLFWKNNVDAELQQLKSDVARQMSETSTFKDILAIDSNRRGFFVIVGARFFQIATGTVVFNFYLQILLREATTSIDPAVGASIVLFIELLMTAVCSVTVDKWGRKPLLLFSSVACFLDLTVETAFFVLKEQTNVDLSEVTWLPLALLIVQTIIYSVGLGVVVTIMSAEMFSASIKCKMFCVTNAIYALITLAFTKFYQSTADGFGLVVPFGCFAVLTLLGVGFVYFIVPETKGKSLEEIQQELKRRRSIKFV